MISRILQDEIYTGTLICQKSGRGENQKPVRKDRYSGGGNGGDTYGAYPGQGKHRTL